MNDYFGDNETNLLIELIPPIVRDQKIYSRLDNNNRWTRSDIEPDPEMIKKLKVKILKYFFPQLNSLDDDVLLSSYSSFKFDEHGEYFDEKTNVTYYDIFTMTKEEPDMDLFDVSNIRIDPHYHIVRVYDDSFHFDLNMRYNENVYIFKSIEFTETKYKRLFDLARFARSNMFTDMHFIFSNCNFEQSFDISDESLYDIGIIIITNSNLKDNMLPKILTKCFGAMNTLKLVIKNIGEHTSHVLDVFKDKEFRFQQVGLINCAQLCGNFPRLKQLTVMSKVFNAYKSNANELSEFKFVGESLIFDEKKTIEYEKPTQKSLRYNTMFNNSTKVYLQMSVYGIADLNKNKIPVITSMILDNGFQQDETMNIINIGHNYIIEMLDLRNLEILGRFKLNVKCSELRIFMKQYPKMEFDVDFLRLFGCDSTCNDLKSTVKNKFQKHWGYNENWENVNRPIRHRYNSPDIIKSVWETRHIEYIPPRPRSKPMIRIRNDRTKRTKRIPEINPHFITPGTFGQPPLYQNDDGGYVWN